MPLPFSLLYFVPFFSNCSQLPIWALSFCTWLLAPRDISQHKRDAPADPASSVRLGQTVCFHLQEVIPVPGCPELGCEKEALVHVKAAALRSDPVLGIWQPPGRSTATRAARCDGLLS